MKTALPSPIKVAADGWQARYFAKPAPAVALTPTGKMSLAKTTSVSFRITNFPVAGPPRPSGLTVDYYGMGGLPNDFGSPKVLVQNEPSAHRELRLEDMARTFREARVVPGTAVSRCIKIHPQGTLNLFNQSARRQAESLSADYCTVEFRLGRYLFRVNSGRSAPSGQCPACLDSGHGADIPERPGGAERRPSPANQKAGLRKLPLRDYLAGHDSPARERALDG